MSYSVDIRDVWWDDQYGMYMARYGLNYCAMLTVVDDYCYTGLSVRPPTSNDGVALFNIQNCNGYDV